MDLGFCPLNGNMFGIRLPSRKNYLHYWFLSSLQLQPNLWYKYLLLLKYIFPYAADCGIQDIPLGQSASMFLDSTPCFIDPYKLFPVL